MGLRREGREAAIQLLFAHDLHDGVGEKTPFELQAFWELHQGSAKVRALAEQMADGVREHLVTIDQHLNTVLHNFTTERLADVDRNILRLGIYELLLSDVPVPVIINEAVEIAKKFSTQQSGRFVNGIIDKLGKEIRKDRPDAPKPIKPAKTKASKAD
jgi:transcription antitermination protein NusB